MMTTAEKWHDDLLALMNRPPAFAYCHASIEDIRKIQSDTLRFAANWYIASVSCNEAGIQLNEVADALERGEDITKLTDRVRMVPKAQDDAPILPQKSLLDIEP